MLVHSARNAVHFHISIEKAPVNPQGYDSGSPSLSTLRWSCFCSPVRPRYQSRAEEREKVHKVCAECTSRGLQRGVMACPQAAWGCSAFVITEGNSRGRHKLYHWQQHKHTLMGKWNSAAAAEAGRRRFCLLCCVTALKTGKKSGPCVCAADSCAKERRFHDLLFGPRACRRVDPTYSFT